MRCASSLTDVSQSSRCRAESIFRTSPCPRRARGKFGNACSKRSTGPGKPSAYRVSQLFSLFLEVEEIERDMLVADLWDAGATGITEEPQALRAFFGPEADRKVLLRQFVDFKPSVQEEEERDWVRFAQD